MYHMLAYHKASAGGVALEDVPGVQDNWASLNASNHYLLPQDMLVRGVYNMSPNITDAQISQPYLRTVALPTPVPFDVGTTPTSIPAVAWYYSPYFRLKATDELAILQSDNAGGAIDKVAFLMLTDNDIRTLPQNNVITLHGTFLTGAAAFTWNATSITINQTIPYGTYAVVGLSSVGANIIATRLSFPSGGTRPGCLTQQTQATKPDMMFRSGRLGVYGTFVSTALPSVEYFSKAGGGVTADLYMDVIKVA